MQLAQTARKIAAKARPGYEAYTAAAEKLDILDDQRKERDKLNSKLSTLDGSRQSLTASIKALDEQLKSIEQSEKQMAELEPQVEQQDALERQRAEAEARIEQRREVRDRLADKKAELADLEADLASIEKGIAERQQLESELAETKVRFADLEAEAARLETQNAVFEAERERLASLQPILADATGADCPVCQQPLTEAHRRAVLKETRERIGEIKGNQTQLGQKLKVMAAKRKSTKARLARLETRLDELARPSDQRALERKVAKKRNDVFAWQAKLEALADATGTVKSLKDALKQLGDPRKLYHQLEGQVGNRSRVERDLAKAAKQLAKLTSEVQDLEKHRADFSQLDVHISAARKTQTGAKADHQVYLKNADVAAKLPTHEKQLAAAAKYLANAEIEAAGVQAALAEAQAAYDARRHKRVSDRLAFLVGERQGLAEKIKLQRAEVKRIEAEIKRLRKVEKEVQTLRTEIDELDQVRALVEYIRTLLKTAGPHIARLLVQAVSQRAAQLYAEIMSDALGQLTWSDSYELTLEAGGRPRQFAQLSGGEQMAAALAVRLALLRELSAIDIAFFDEPTSNLDESRRDNLAGQMVKVSGFSQLFVISHDDTFERLTNHVVRLAKVNGQSQVVAA